MFDENNEDEQPEESEESAEEPAEAGGDTGLAGRWVCPECGNNNPRMIREEVDKSILLNAYPPVYGKKLKCGQCGATWHHK